MAQKPAEKEKDTSKKPSPRKTPTARPLPAPRTPAADEYAHDDSAYDPEMDEPVHRATPPRGDDGKFLSSAENLPAKKHPSGLLKLAARFGISEDAAANITTEDLSNLVHDIANAAAREREEATFERDVRRATAEPPPAPKTPGTAPVSDPDEFGLNFEDESVYDPVLVRENKKMASELSALRKKLKAIEEQVGVLGQREVARANETRNQRIDRLFDSLPEQFKDLLGRGTREEIGKVDPDKFELRLAVLKAAQRIDKNLSDEAFHQAVKKLFPTVAASTPAPVPTPAPAPSSQANGRISAEEWEAAGLARTSQRTAAEPRGVNRAVKAVAQKMRDQNLTEEDMAGIEESGLPE